MEKLVLVPQIRIDGPPETVFAEIHSLRFESAVRAYLAMDFNPPFGRVEGEGRAFGEGGWRLDRCSNRQSLPGNSPRLVSDPPIGRVKSLYGMELLRLEFWVRVLSVS